MKPLPPCRWLVPDKDNFPVCALGRGCNNAYCLRCSDYERKPAQQETQQHIIKK